MTIKWSVMITGSYPMREYIWMAKEIERYGFDELHIADDLIMRPAWPILTLIGEHTKTIKIGPAIVTPKVAHPVYHASNLVALDELTDGRAVCGIGRGGLNQLIGINKPEQTIKMLREAIQVMERVIARDTKPYEGEFFSATRQLQLHHKPIRNKIPLFIGTWGPKIARLGGQITTGIKADCVADTNYLKLLADNVRDGAVSAGKDPTQSQVIVGPLCSISRDYKAAARTIKELLAIFLPFTSPMKEKVGIDERDIIKANKAYLAGDYDIAVQHVPEEAVQAFSLTGTPEQIIPQIEGLIGAGATNIAFGPPHGPEFREMIRLAGEEIVPYFRS